MTPSNTIYNRITSLASYGVASLLTTENPLHGLISSLIGDPISLSDPDLYPCNGYALQQKQLTIIPLQALLTCIASSASGFKITLLESFRITTAAESLRSLPILIWKNGALDKRVINLALDKLALFGLTCAVAFAAEADLSFWDTFVLSAELEYISECALSLDPELATEILQDRLNLSH